MRVVFVQKHDDPVSEDLRIMMNDPDDQTVPSNTCFLSSVRTDNGFLVLTLFEADGTRHDQRACFPGPGYEQETDLFPFDVKGVRIALCCGDDIFQPQIARTASLLGCSLLLCATNHVLTSDLLQNGPWSACQANCLPIAVRSSSQDVHLFLPCVLTRDGSGMGETQFDTNDLTRAYHSFPIRDGLNASFFRRYREELSR